MALDYYGGRCTCCGEADPAFLTFDHINGGGNQHRRVVGIRAPYFYEFLIKNNYPEEYQVLCWNCNAAKHFNPGGCPHRRVK